ncbi:MAG TPA: hypothetical protein VF048_02975, partial [Gemmatimonadaceae bacterium]
MSDFEPLTLACAVVLTLTAGAATRELVAQPSPPRMPAGRVSLAPLRDGARDADFLYGTWKVAGPGYRTGSANEIVDGRVRVRSLARGRVVADYEAVLGDGSRLTGLELMLYDPKTRQWAVQDARGDSAALLEPPAYGHFDEPPDQGTQGR